LPVRSVERVAIRHGALPAAKVDSGATICLRARDHPERKGESCSRAPRLTGSAGHLGHRKWRPRGNPSPVAASTPAQMCRRTIRRDQPDPCAMPVSFQCRAELGRTGEDAKEPLVRGRRFAALDANAHLIPRRGVSPSCQKVRTVIKSLSVCPRGHHCCLGWADLAEGRLCLDHLPAMAVRRLSSPALARIPRDAKKVSGPSSSADAAAASGAG
jgi:hypothetical protein